MRARRAAACAAAALLTVLSSVVVVAAAAEERATILWKGEAHPVGMHSGKEFAVSEAARVLGLSVSSDPSTGVLTISGGGHQILLGPGTAQVPVDRRIVPISAPARGISGTTPLVERVIRRRDSAMPSPSIAIRIASRTASKL